MTTLNTVPANIVPISRPTFHEQCQGRTCTSTYIAGTPDQGLLRTWRLAHAHHWDQGDDDA